MANQCKSLPIIGLMAAIILAAACGNGSRNNRKGFTRQYSADSSFSIEVPDILESVNSGDRFIAFGNDEKQTFVSATRMPSFDFKQFDAMTTAEAGKSAENLTVETIERTDSVIKLKISDGGFAAEKYYLHKKGLGDDFLIVIESFDNTLGVKDVQYIANSLREEKATVPFRMLGETGTEYTSDGFSVGSDYVLQVNKSYLDLQARRKLPSGSPKLTGSYECVRDTLNSESATYININVFDVSEVGEEPLDTYIKPMQDRGIATKKGTFLGQPSVVYSYNRATPAGKVIPTKAMVVIRFSRSYVIEVASRADVAAKFNAFTSSFSFISQ